MNKNNTLGGKRSSGLDIIKSLAILFVVGVHFFLNTKYYTTNLNSSNLYIQVCTQQLFLSCIPLFLMSTGYLNNNTEISSNYFKKILPILGIYLLYSIPALLYRYSINEIPLDISLWIKQFFTFKGHRYSWYINLYFGLFLLIPFFNRMYSSLLNKKEKFTLIVILLALTTIKGIPNYWASIYPLAYFYIGKFIKEFQPSLKTNKCIFYLIAIILLQATIEYSVASEGVYSNYFNHYASIFRAIQSILIFIMLYKKDIKNARLKSLVTNISTSTLDIYLASFLTDRILYKPFKALGLNQETMFLFLPILVLSSFTLAYIIAKIRINYIKLESKNKNNNIDKIKKQVA